MEETIMYNSQHTAKFEFLPSKMEIRLFLVFVMKKNEFLTAKLAQVTPMSALSAVTQKLRWTVLKKVNKG